MIVAHRYSPHMNCPACKSVTLTMAERPFRNDNRPGYRKKRREGFLGELFDFD